MKKKLHLRELHIRAAAGQNSCGRCPKQRKGDCKRMSTRSNNLVNPNAREAMNRFKMEGGR